MNSKTLAIATIVSTFSFTAAVQAENLDHTRQLLATRQCSGCNLSRAGLVFAELSYANLIQADLSGANLSRANLQGADLRGANLLGASLNGANLAGAKLDGANLMATDLRGAYLEGATLEGAVIDKTYLQGTIGLAPTVGKAEDFYKWAIEAERQKNYVVAFENFTQVINRKPTFAPAYFGRGAARAQAGDRKGAIVDTREAERLFRTQGDTESAEVANKIATALEKPPAEEKKRGGFGQMLMGLLGGALQLFLTRFPLPFF